MVVSSVCILGVYFFLLERKCHSSLSFPDCPNGLEYIAFSGMVMYNATHGNRVVSHNKSTKS